MNKPQSADRQTATHARVDLQGHFHTEREILKWEAERETDRDHKAWLQARIVKSKQASAIATELVAVCNEARRLLSDLNSAYGAEPIDQFLARIDAALTGQRQVNRRAR